MFLILFMIAAIITGKLELGFLELITIFRLFRFISEEGIINSVLFVDFLDIFSD